MAPAYKSQSALVKSFQPGDRALAMACRTTVPGLEKERKSRWSRLRKKPALISKIHGRVQGVYFRASTVQCAQELGLTGWVKNCDDGSVEGLPRARATGLSN